MVQTIEITEKLTLQAEKIGKGPKLFFLAGGGATIHYYHPFLEKLGKHFEIIALHYPGFHNTINYRSELTLEYYTAIVAKFLQTFGKSHHVLAHSMGGGIALSVDARYPKLISKMVLMAPMLQQFSLTESKILARVAVNATKSTRKSTLLTKKEASIFLEENLQNYPEMSKQLKMLRTNFRVPLEHVTPAKKLLLLGGDDVIFPIKEELALAKKLQRAEIVVLTGHGHDLMYSAENEVLELIQEFAV